MEVQVLRVPRVLLDQQVLKEIRVLKVLKV